MNIQAIQQTNFQGKINYTSKDARNLAKKYEKKY